MTNRLATSLIALSTAFAAPALADVTAADVWSNQQAFYTAMGVTLSGDLSGDQLVTPELNVILPQGIASFRMTTDSAVTLADNGNGTVTVSYPSPMKIMIEGGAQGEGSFAADFTMTHDGYTIIASGEPGDIAYESNVRNIRFEAGDITMDDPMSEKMTFEGFATFTEWVGTSQVTEGNVIAYTANSTVGDSVIDINFDIDNVASRTLQTAAPVQSVVALSLPVGGSDVMNLSAAMRDGFSVLIDSTGGGNSSETVTTMNGESMSTQNTSIGAQTFSLEMGENGLVIDAETSDFNLSMNDPMLFPGDLDFAMDSVTASYDVPLNASEDPQDFRVATSLTGFTVGDAIWDLFDPAGQLPRDPAEISFDVTGMGTNATDLLDIMAMSQMFGPPAVEIDEVTIENLRIAAAGAEVMAQGAMTFDWTDFQTIPGIARPEGQVTVNLNGVNALMDKLSAMGLIPEEELMMPRMMMGMFSTPVGDDMLETVLEVNSEGHVLANGQRLQ